MQVLEELDGYVDGELSDTRREQIEAHLRGCDWCTKFGGEYASLVATLRNDLLQAERQASGQADELARRILSSRDENS